MRRIDIFFYGLFMDADALRAKGLNPINVCPARVFGMAPRIGKRAAMVEDPAGSTYGFVMKLAHSEIEQLYAEPSVRMYRPEAVNVELADGSTIAALCFNLPTAPPPEESNPEYVANLRELGRRLGLPSEYWNRLR